MLLCNLYLCIEESHMPPKRADEKSTRSYHLSTFLLAVMLAVSVLLAGCNPFSVVNKNNSEPADSWRHASWGWVKSSMQDTAFTRDGHPTIEVTDPDGSGAFSVADWNNANSVDTSKYSHLHFWVNGGQAGDQVVGVMVYTDG